MPKNTDLRVVRTRQMIKEAFLELMETVGFTKITIDSIAKKAFISRNTFYLHYVDKYDLLDKLEDDILLGLKEIAGAIRVEAMKEKGFVDESIVVILNGIFEYIRENQRFFSLIMGKNGNPAFSSKLGEMMSGVALNKISNFSLSVPQNYMVAIMTGVQTNVIQEWVRGGMKETPEEITSIFTTIFKDVPKNLLKD